MNRNFIAILFTVFVYMSCYAQEKSSNILDFSMKTRWTNEVDDKNLWNAYPRPQLERDNWTNLNGYWEYAITPIQEKFPNSYDGKILVPFAVESELSGVKKTVGEDKYLWYRKTVSISDVNQNEKIHLNFGAVDWEAVVYVNGKLAGSHKGGFTAFSIDISSFFNSSPNQEIVVRVWDPTDDGTQARGKQVRDPKGIWYTPVTGIWQTVWIERTRIDYIKELKNFPNIDSSDVKLHFKLAMASQPLQLVCNVKDGEQIIISKKLNISSGTELAGIEIAIPDAKLWSPDNPFLYNLDIQLKTLSGEVVDDVQSYFGMRKISKGKDASGHTRILLNNLPLFQFGLLDQGWWPDGLYTAPNEEAMMYDVEMTKKWGFNMLRKHVKVEPARYYYNCDKMGMLVWQDMPNGNYFEDLRIEAWERYDAKRPLNSALQFEKELKEMMDQFASFPSIVVWVPFNEGWGQYDTERIASWVKSYDPTRLCDAPSGWADRFVGDIVDNHIYPGPGIELPEENRVSVIGEFGGLGWPVENHMWWNKKNWGYLTFYNETDFTENFTNLIKDLVGLKSYGLSGAIYTQTTDVEGEVNGLMTYDREVVKISPEVTQKLFAPLYKPAQNRRMLLNDSENGSPEQWKVSTKVDNENWINENFDDSNWSYKPAPFSSFENPFLPNGSALDNQKTTYVRKEIFLNDLLNNINIKFYLLKANIDLYVNGEKVNSYEDKGGRKRHYTSNRIERANTFLKPGKNIIAVKIIPKDENSSFDMGIYSSKIID